MPAAIILASPAGSTSVERLISHATRASLHDLIDLLGRHRFAPIIVAAPGISDLALIDLPPLILSDDAPDRPFHFGERVADLISLLNNMRRSESTQSDHNAVLIVGAGSVPLWDDSIGDRLLAFATIPESDRSAPVVLTNNRHSSDWLLIRTESAIAAALPVIRAAGRDNSLAWRLGETLGADRVTTLIGTDPIYGFDLDTPADLGLLAACPRTPPHLRRWLDRSAGAWASIPVPRVIDTLRREGSTIALIGRVSPSAWLTINEAARCWTRVIGEERGMVANGRAEAGLVRSVLHPWIAARGVDGFFSDLAGLCDAALFDTRVLFATLGLNLTANDRFASDLLMPDAIANHWLRAFTVAAANCPIPLILGGHSVVAGGVHVLTQLVQN